MKTLRPFGLILGCVLLAANIVAFQVIISEQRLKIDLTSDAMYTVSPVTVELLENLSDEIVIRGFLSRESEPSLEPLVPRLTSLLEEYTDRNPEKIDLAVGDPLADSLRVVEAASYGVKPQLFRHKTRRSSGFKQSYFSVVVQLGDQFETLQLMDLIDVSEAQNELVVRLKNPEYLLTSAIKKLQAKVNAANLLYSQAEGHFDVYFSDPEKLRALGGTAAEMATRTETWREVVVETLEELSTKTSGRLSYRLLEGPVDQSEQTALAQATGLQPRGFLSFSEEGNFRQLTMYADGILQVGGRRILVQCSGEADFNPNTFRVRIEELLKRMLPGFQRSVGVALDPTALSPQELNQLTSAGGNPWYRLLVSTLGIDHEVRQVDLEAGVPEVDALCLIRPQDLSEAAAYNIDQFVMRGGKLLLLTDKAEWAQPSEQRQMQIRQIETGLDSLLVAWGVEQEPFVLQDERCWSPLLFFIEKNNTRNPMVSPYPYTPAVVEEGMNRDMPISAGLELVIPIFTCPLKITPVEGIEATTLLSSSARSWTEPFNPMVHPFDVTAWNGQYTHTFLVPGDDPAFPPTAEHPLAERVLAVALEGTFPSSFAQRPGQPGGELFPHLTSSPEGQRMVVIADAEGFSDYANFLLEPQGTSRELLNGPLIKNSLDWLMQDEELMQIRNRGVKRRHLRELDDAKKDMAQMLCFVVPFLIVVFGGIFWNFGLRLLGAPAEQQ